MRVSRRDRGAERSEHERVEGREGSGPKRKGPGKRKSRRPRKSTRLDPATAPRIEPGPGQRIAAYAAAGGAAALAAGEAQRRRSRVSLVSRRVWVMRIWHSTGRPMRSAAIERPWPPIERQPMPWWAWLGPASPRADSTRRRRPLWTRLRHLLPRGHWVLAAALARLGRPADARRAIEICLEQAPDMPEGHDLLARLLERSFGDPLGAARHRKQASELRRAGTVREAATPEP